MKKLFFLTVLFSGIIQFSFAQRSVVSLHVQPLVIGEVRGAYEFAFTNKFSFVANFGFIPEHDLPGLLDPDVTPSDYGLPVGITNTISGYNFVPEFRIYLNKHDNPRGFYFSPYLKFAKYSAVFNQTFNYDFTAAEYDELDDEIQAYIDENNPSLDVNTQLTSSFGTIGGGIQFGYQLLIAERLSLDFYFLGIGVNQVTISTEVFSPDADALGIDYTVWGDEIESALDDLDGIPLLDPDFEIESETNKIVATAKALAPWYRGGLKIGFAF